MPRPTRAQGRPGTKVIPKNWASHSKVVEKTWTAVCDIFPPRLAGDKPTVNADLSVTPAGSQAALYTDQACRLQVLNAQDAVKILGDQAQATVTYLVVVDRDVQAPHMSVIHVKECDDASFVGRRLSTRKVDRGSILWERDLYAVDDLTAPDPE